MPIIVGIDEIVFLPIEGDNSAELEAYGVTTCICLALYGHKEDHSRFIGMYHWSGFNDTSAMSESDKNENIYGLVCRLVTNARDQLSLDENASLYLDNFFVIGGEREQEMLAGTEFEVEALKTYIQSECEEEFVFSDATNFSFQNYLTSGEDVLTVTMKTTSMHPHWLVSRAETQMDRSLDEDSDLGGASPFNCCY